ncbi:carbon-nitrogen family hydrolase [Gracilibacillus marinus]|uniref:Carbon-nitrogen family hydrolase n=1 Tax=Gracilibacillus marinus TaxID=630535 RepID=A0ABV8VY81_9BACI
MKFAIYQMDVIPANPEANKAKIIDWMETELVQDVDTVVLPEMWNAGYALDQLEEYADKDGRDIVPFLKNLAKQHDKHIIAGSIANKREDGIYNTSYIITKQGELIHQYDKMHLVPMLDEHVFLQAGKEKGKIFELDGMKIGVVICYDLRFPELMRSLALLGAEVIIVVAQWPTSRRVHWHYLQYARAIENQCYIISANSSGECNGTQFAGESYVIEPTGKLVTEGPKEKEATIIAEIDRDIVTQFRKDIPIFKSRVPHLYE